MHPTKQQVLWGTRVGTWVLHSKTTYPAQQPVGYQVSGIQLYSKSMHPTKYEYTVGYVLWGTRIETRVLQEYAPYQVVNTP